MRHRNKINRLGRPAGHRKALLMNLAKSLIMHKRIVTTLAKGKVLRTFIEPILTRAKQDTTHSRRMVFSHFQDKEPVKELFNQIAEKIEQRPGGYTRVIKLPNRAGDNAAMCMIELVDYNDIYTKEAKVVKITRRRRKKSASASSTEEAGTESVAETVSEVVADQE
ncbi:MULTISPECIES: 50S ribosomal protein L17 [Candidatus Cardinium]|uniref:50S ribosomal protein L17 n=1 Tax=Candidatus Cardinium TaxID=273135 RepID=UPI001FAAEDB2|nr:MULTISPECIES: 50S ribosomal protein L17 [Cardinium]